MNGLRIGLVGARGYVGAELIRLVAAHPRFELAYVTSRERAGQPGDHDDEDQVEEELEPGRTAAFCVDGQAPGAGHCPRGFAWPRSRVGAPRRPGAVWSRDVR